MIHIRGGQGGIYLYREQYIFRNISNKIFEVRTRILIEFSHNMPINTLFVEKGNIANVSQGHQVLQTALSTDMN